MIAEVYPLTRLPRNKKTFDYLIPDFLTIFRGNLVSIPYRNKHIWGIVRGVKDKPPRGITLKTVLDVQTDLHLREEELSFFESLAQDLAQSVSSLLYASVPLPPKRTAQHKPVPLSWLPLTLSNSEAEHAVRVVRSLTQRGKAFVQTPDVRRAAAIILGYMQQKPNQKILILVPTLRDIQLLRSHLTGQQPQIISGEETNNERYQAWTAFRNASAGILLGIRTALLTIDSTITTIFLLKSGEKNHKQHDRNPRYDARELVWKFQEAFASNVFCLDVSPSCSTLTRFHEIECLAWGLYPSISVVNINQEKTASSAHVVSYTANEAISQTLLEGKQVLCIYNKKGKSKEIRCRECAYRFLCPTCLTSLTAFSHTLECARCRYKEGKPLRCPSCTSMDLIPIGYGNERVAKELSTLFPSAQITIVDKEHPYMADAADILLATTYYYETVFDPFKKTDIGLVVHLNVDAPLYDSSPTAIEELFRQTWQWAWFAFGARAAYIIQTASPDLVTGVMENPFKLIQEELQARQRYLLPPFYRWCRIVYKDSERRKAEIALKQLSDELSNIPEITLHGVQWNQKGHGFIECGLPKDSFHLLSPLFTALPDRYIIDTNVFS